MNKLFSLFLAFILIIGFASAKIDKYCVDSDEAINIWTAGFATSDHGIDYDDCDGASGNLKEFYCNGEDSKFDNIKCSDFNAVCVSADGGDYCACADGYVLDNGTCVEEVIPEFGVVAGVVALVGALGVFVYKRQ